MKFSSVVLELFHAHKRTHETSDFNRRSAGMRTRLKYKQRQIQHKPFYYVKRLENHTDELWFNVTVC
jgi:hypothetical protein